MPNLAMIQSASPRTQKFLTTAKMSSARSTQRKKKYNSTTRDVRTENLATMVPSSEPQKNASEGIQTTLMKKMKTVTQEMMKTVHNRCPIEGERRRKGQGVL